MIKKIVALILVLISLTFVGCQKVESVSKDVDNTSMFVIIENTGSWTVVYHKQTKVMYAVSMSTYNCGTFTVLLNADGTPMLWEGR